MPGSVVGIVALQGDFHRHELALRQLGYSTQLVRSAEQFAAVDAVVLPGGESTALLRLADAEFRHALVDKIISGCPTLATCAGVILLAREVNNPAQESLGLLDISVSRNGYGRQINSFITPELTWTSAGELLLARAGMSQAPVEGVFIRAPRISDVGVGAQTILSYNTEPVLVRQGNIFGATFHPELNETASVIHELFLKGAGA